MISSVTLGEGLNEYHRPQRALDLFNRALKIAASTPDMGIPFHVYIGKVSALEELNRRQEAQAVLNFALDEARRAGILGAQADLLREDGELAVDNGDFALARTYYEECASVSERGHLTRLLADAMFKLTNLYQQAGDLTRAEQCVERGIQAVRQATALLLRRYRSCSQRTFYSSAVLVLAGFVTSRLNLAITAREAVKQVLYVPQWEDVFIAYGVIAIGVALFSFAVRHLPIFASPAGQGADSTAQTELAHARL